MKIKVKDGKKKKEKKDAIFLDNIKGSSLRQLYYDQIKSNRAFSYTCLVLALIMAIFGVLDIAQGLVNQVPIAFPCALAFAILATIYSERIARIQDAFFQSVRNDFFYDSLDRLYSVLSRKRGRGNGQRKTK